jgi:Mrp family chromosome partitioning ATPase
MSNLSPRATPGDNAPAITNAESGSGLRAAFTGAGRRWRPIALFAIVTSAAAFLVSSQGAPKYSALAQVLISRQSLAATVSGSVDPSLAQQPDRVAQTQAEIARNPVVAQRTVAAAGAHENWATFLAHTSVSPSPNSDVLIFNVTDANRYRAGKLATDYAEQFVRYRRELDADGFQTALGEVANNLRSLRAAGKRSSSLYRDLVAKVRQLRTLQSLQTGNTTVLRAATDARQVEPHPMRSLVLGGLLAVITGAILAGLAEARDTTIRTPDELAQLTGTPPFAYLPSPRPRPSPEATIHLDSPAMEPYRILAANLTIVASTSTSKAVLVTSALPEEGKSTTVANMATALAAGGLRVLVFDADSRAPTLHKHFGLPARPGLFDVVSPTNSLEVAWGTTSLAEVTRDVELSHVSQDTTWRRIWLDPISGAAAFRPSRNEVVGRLSVVPAGTPPSDPLVTLGNRGLADLVQQVRDSYDFVLIDAPALLPVADTLSLLPQVDGVLLVAMLERIRRSQLIEVTRSLSRADVPLLGIAATGEVPSPPDTFKHIVHRSNPDGPSPAFRARPVAPVTTRADF